MINPRRSTYLTREPVQTNRAISVGMDGHKPLSMNLRSRALAVVDEGMIRRAAARRFGVATATAIRWHDQRRSTGSRVAKAQRGGTRSGRIGAHAHTILALHTDRRDITLDESCATNWAMRA